MTAFVEFIDNQDSSRPNLPIKPTRYSHKAVRGVSDPSGFFPLSLDSPGSCTIRHNIASGVLDGWIVVVVFLD